MPVESPYAIQRYILKNPYLQPKEMPQQDLGSLQGQPHLNALVLQKFREVHGQPPATEQMGDKNPGFWAPSPEGAVWLFLFHPRTSPYCNPPPTSIILHFHLITNPLPPCSHLTPPPACTQSCYPPPFVPHPQVWMGPYGIEGQGEGGGFGNVGEGGLGGQLGGVLCFSCLGCQNPFIELKLWLELMGLTELPPPRSWIPPPSTRLPSSLTFPSRTHPPLFPPQPRSFLLT